MAFNISTGVLNVCNSGILQLHDTFAQNFYYFHEDTQTIVSENPTHSATWGSSPFNTTTTKTTVSGTFRARIYWNKNQAINIYGDTVFQSTANLPKGWARIITDVTGKAVVEHARRLRFEDELFELDSDRERHGLFTKNLYEFYLKPAT